MPIPYAVPVMEPTPGQWSIVVASASDRRAVAVTPAFAVTPAVAAVPAMTQPVPAVTTKGGGVAAGYPYPGVVWAR